MRRRPFLATALAAGSGFLAGCLDSGGGSSPTTSPPAGDIGCPTYGDRVETVICTPELPDPDAEMAMQPASASGELPEASYEFSLENERDTRFNVNFYQWKLQKYVDGEWFYVAPREWPEPLMRLEPGESHTWTLTVDNTDLARSIPSSVGSESATVAGLGGGTYSFGVPGWFEGEDTSAQTAFATRFELSGDQLTLGPTPDVSERVRDGDTVLVDWPVDQGDPVTYRVTRLKSVPEDAERVIAEQVIRDTPLRNALALFERWSRIVEIDTRTGAFSHATLTEDRTIEYQGTGYEIEVE